MTTKRRWTRWLRRLVLYPLLALLVIGIGAFTFLTMTRYPQQDAHDVPLVLTGATVLVGDDLDPQDDTTVLVRDGGIDEVGPADDVDVPAEAQVVDLEGHTLLPGLIDMHIHLGTPEIEPGEDYGWTTMPRSIIDIMRHAPDQRRAMLEHGVTAFRSLADQHPWILELREMVEDGELEGPRVFGAGPIFTTRGGHPVQTIHDGEVIDGAVEVPATPDEARRTTSALASEEGGVDVIKVVQERDTDDEPLEPIATDVLAAIVDEAATHGLPVVGHWGAHADMQELLAAGVDGLEHFQLRDEMLEAWPEGELEMILDAGIHLGPTLAVTEAAAPGPPAEMWEQLQARLAELHDAGVPVVASSDAPMNGLAFGAGLHREFELLVEFGLTPQEALRAATSTAAEALGTDDIGVIEPGRDADLLGIDGDPLDDIAAVSEVAGAWREGRPVIDVDDERS